METHNFHCENCNPKNYIVLKLGQDEDKYNQKCPHCGATLKYVGCKQMFYFANQNKNIK